MSEMASFEPRTVESPRNRAPEDLMVRLARPTDASAIAAISATREGLDAASIVSRVQGELDHPLFGSRLAVWVAIADDEVRGFARARWDDQAEGTGPSAAPTGWYLMGVVVQPAWRRRSIGRALLQARLAWLSEFTDCVYSMTSERNLVSLALLESVGFAVERRGVSHPRIAFNKGAGLLLRCDTSAEDDQE